MPAARVSTFGLGVMLLSACSGASAPEIPAVTETANTEPVPGEVTESIPSHAQDGSTSADPPSSSEGDPPAPPPAPPPPPPCTDEVEPNDSVARATAFTACIAGVLATSRDRDFLSVVAPAGARTMTVEHEEGGGSVLYRVGRKKGTSVDFDETFTDEAPVIEVAAGATYVFRLTFAPGGSKTERPYELSVTFE